MTAILLNPPDSTPFVRQPHAKGQLLLAADWQICNGYVANVNPRHNMV